MCLVSDKIKFCTCKASSPEKLNNYWLLHRFAKGKNLYVLGTPSMPTYLTDPNFIINNFTLEKRLNEPDAFDFPVAFKPKDQLVIVFNSLAQDYEKILTYCFRFTKEKWVSEEYDVFGLMSRYDEIAFGKLKNFKTRTQNTK